MKEFVLMLGSISVLAGAISLIVVGSTVDSISQHYRVLFIVIGCSNCVAMAVHLIRWREPAAWKRPPNGS